MNRSERLVGLLAARRPEPAMTVARSVSDVLDDHVVFEVESIDRMYLNVWQPRLAHGGGVQGFFVGRRGNHYASTALMDPMTKTFVADIHGFVAARGLELVHFAKGQRKDDLAQEFLGRFNEAEEELALHGIAGFSVRAVARRAGVSHQAPLHQFGSGAGMLTALAARGFQALSTHLTAAEEAVPVSAG